MGQDILHDIPGCTGVGIYCIVDDVDGRKYIGQSINIFRRLLQHKAAMESGQCNAKITQAIMDGHTFHAKVLEELPASTSHYDLLIKENEWITRENSIENGLNENMGLSRLDVQKKADQFKNWVGDIEELQGLRYDLKQKINPYSSIQRNLPRLRNYPGPNKSCNVKCNLKLPTDIACHLCDMADRSGETITTFLFKRLVEIAERDSGESEPDKQYGLDFYKKRDRNYYTAAEILTLLKDPEYIAFLIDYLNSLFVGWETFRRYTAIEENFYLYGVRPADTILALTEDNLDEFRNLSKQS